ncbi:uncharacterized protein LOC143374080 [Andrena cerasifolii]|uniref:uncharacterized protein LOC143374080 n=1 Tax=Andrena cerasifolii TaxID=2819439 RepID=UPI004037C835
MAGKEEAVTEEGEGAGKENKKPRGQAVFVYDIAKTMPTSLQPRFDQVEGASGMRDESAATRVALKAAEGETEKGRAAGGRGAQRKRGTRQRKKKQRQNAGWKGEKERDRKTAGERNV